MEKRILMNIYLFVLTLTGACHSGLESRDYSVNKGLTGLDISLYQFDCSTALFDRKSEIFAQINEIKSSLHSPTEELMLYYITLVTDSCALAKTKAYLEK